MGGSIDQYIDSRPDDLKPLLLNVREALLQLHPVLEETVKYNTPFYTHKGQSICYLTIKKNRDFVEVGFVKGFKLSDMHHKLVTDNRSIVRGLRFWDFNEEDKQVLLDTVYEAIELD